MYKWVAVLLLAVAVTIVTAQPAQAAPPAQSAYGVRCLEDTCRLRISPNLPAKGVAADDIWLEFMRSSISQMPGELGLVINNSITLSLPNGKIRLTDAEIYLMTDGAGGVANLYGSALLPAVQSQAYGEMLALTPVRVEFGYQVGSTLTHLAAPLEPTQHYWHMSITSSVELAVASEPAVIISVLPGQHLQVVVDPTEGLFWFDGLVTVQTEGSGAALSALLEADTLSDESIAQLFTRSTDVYNVQVQTGSDTGTQVAANALVRRETNVRREAGVPLMLQGSLVLNPAGLLISGAVATDVPLRAFVDARVAGQIFAPFTQWSDLAARAEATVYAPLLGIDEALVGTFGPDPTQTYAFTQARWAEEFQPQMP